jgi:hypothetical protein
MTILDRLEEARGHLGAAQMQREWIKDQIIADHIDGAERILRQIITDIRRRPTLVMLPEHVLPLARLDDVQDTPEAAA